MLSGSTYTDNNFGIKIKSTNYVKESYWLSTDQLCFTNYIKDNHFSKNCDFFKVYFDELNKIYLPLSFL